MADLRFKPIDHPSDVGIIAYGKTLQEIFENAALGMFSLMADLDKVKPKQTLRLRVEGEDLESLLVNWLNELIFNEDAKKMLFKAFKITKLSSTEVEAEVAGEKVDPKIHDIYRPIKAATYNQLEIHPNWAKVIFDV